MNCASQPGKACSALQECMNKSEITVIPNSSDDVMIQMLISLLEERLGNHIKKRIKLD